MIKLKKSGISVFLIQWFNDILSKFDESNYFWRDKGDNENFIVLLYDFDLCQNSAHVKLHSSKEEQCAKVK